MKTQICGLSQALSDQTNRSDRELRQLLAELKNYTQKLNPGVLLSVIVQRADLLLHSYPFLRAIPKRCQRFDDKRMIFKDGI